MDVAPPYLPFQNHGKTPKPENLTDALTSAATAVVNVLNGKILCVSTTMTPEKRAHVSGQYLEHLERIKSLHDSGVLSSEEFAEQKRFALDNIRKINAETEAIYVQGWSGQYVARVLKFAVLRLLRCKVVISIGNMGSEGINEIPVHCVSQNPIFKQNLKYVGTN